jgi:UDP-3-O-[3-hydroxymyristoyl] glucosamine N-acyltransferase
MKLSEWCAPGTAVLRDADFYRLGTVETMEDGLLTYADSLLYLKSAANNPNVRGIITTSPLASKVPEHIGVIIAENPRNLFFNIHSHFVQQSLYKPPFAAGIGSGCHIHKTAQIASGCRIDDGVRIGEYVVIASPVWIGNDVRIEPGVKLGVEGILYDRREDGLTLLPHGGYVRIHDGAALMTNATVVRSVHDTDITEIGQSALIGLSSIVGHEAKIGARAVISNQCLIARKTLIGNDAYLGTQCMIKENIKVGDKARIMAGSVVIRDVPSGMTVSGNFATEHNSRMLEFARQGRLSA